MKTIFSIIRSSITILLCIPVAILLLLIVLINLEPPTDPNKEEEKKRIQFILKNQRVDN